MFSGAQSFLLTHVPSQRRWMLPTPAKKHEQSCGTQMGHCVGKCLRTKEVKKKTPQSIEKKEGDQVEAWFIIEICVQTF